MAECVELESKVKVLGRQHGQCNVVSVRPLVGLQGVVHARVDIYSRMADTDWHQHARGKWSAWGCRWWGVGHDALRYILRPILDAFDVFPLSIANGRSFDASGLIRRR